MKFSVLAALVAASSVNAHTIFQDVSVDGVSQGQLTGLRTPNQNNPVYDVTSTDMVCDKPGYTSTSIISVNPGSKIGYYWEHVLGGPQFANDPDNPIASSHHGPIQIYLAKVANAATSSQTGLQWFKVASQGFDTGSKVWGVDTMVAQQGWWYWNIPQCLAAGDYLARVEIIALHNAYTSMGEQFYVGCAQIRVSGSGTWTGSNYISFPGTYQQNDPGILINIYGPSGGPDNGGKPYVAPGGAVQTCPSGSGPAPTTTTSATKAPTTAVTTTTSATKAPTTTAVTTTAAPTTAKPTTTATKTTTAPSSGQTLYGQCGGSGWTGPTTCSAGTCKVLNAYYSQCI